MCWIIVISKSFDVATLNAGTTSVIHQHSYNYTNKPNYCSYLFYWHQFLAEVHKGNDGKLCLEEQRNCPAHLASFQVPPEQGSQVTDSRLHIEAVLYFCPSIARKYSWVSPCSTNYWNTVCISVSTILQLVSSVLTYYILFNHFLITYFTRFHPNNYWFEQWSSIRTVTFTRICNAIKNKTLPEYDQIWRSCISYVMLLSKFSGKLSHPRHCVFCRTRLDLPFVL